MRTERLLRSLGIAAVFVLAEACSMAQTPPRSEQQRVRDDVQSFLTTWLVDRNIEKAKLSFGAAAIGNEAILQASCAGYIRPEERGSEMARRTGVQKFLQDFLPQKPVTALGEVLTRDATSVLLDQLGTKITNDPRADLFVLAKLSKAELPGDDPRDVDYLRKNLPSSFYISFVPVGQGMIYFVWVSQGNEWRIYHASLVCM